MRSAVLPAVAVPLLIIQPVLGLMLGAGTAQAAGTAWYVAPGGAASAPCGMTTVHACGSINAAIGEAAGGDTIVIAAGVYPAASAADLVVVNKDLALTGAGAGSTA